MSVLSPARPRVQARPLMLPLRRPFGISRWTLQRAQSVIVELRCDGPRAVEKALPNARYDDSVEASLPLFSDLSIESPRDAAHIAALIDDLDAGPFRGHRAALSALDMALWDLLAKREQKSVCELLALPGVTTPPTSYTIGLDDPRAMAEQAVLAAAHHPVLKIKLGTANDREIIERIRAAGVTCPLLVDANEGLGDRQRALDVIAFLATRGVVMVEQPLPAARVDDAAWLHERSPLPLYADEAFVDGEAFSSISDAYSGVNLKLDKLGGLSRSLRAARQARALGLGLLVGCMVSSSLAITAAAHVATLADLADLDGHLLLARDPFCGVTMSANGQLRLPSGVGLGVEWLVVDPGAAPPG